MEVGSWKFGEKLKLGAAKRNGQRAKGKERRAEGKRRTSNVERLTEENAGCGAGYWLSVNC
jgi:hypothetical protein